LFLSASFTENTNMFYVAPWKSSVNLSLTVVLVSFGEAVCHSAICNRARDKMLF